MQDTLKNSLKVLPDEDGVALYELKKIKNGRGSTQASGHSEIINQKLPSNSNGEK